MTSITTIRSETNSVNIKTRVIIRRPGTEDETVILDDKCKMDVKLYTGVIVITDTVTAVELQGPCNHPDPLAI